MKKSNWEIETDKLIAGTQAMIKPSGRFFDEVEISFFDGFMYFKLDEIFTELDLCPQVIRRNFITQRKSKEKIMNLILHDRAFIGKTLMKTCLLKLDQRC